MTNFVCKHCNNKFKTEVILLQHQRRAKYCLKLQGKDKEFYICTCGKQYTTKFNLNRHTKKCYIAKIEQLNKEQPTVSEKVEQESEEDIEEPVKPEITRLMTMMKELQQQMSQLSANKKMSAKLGDNLQPITDKDLSEYLDSLSLDFIERGIKGYADYAGSYPFKDKIICTDRSRKKLKYKNENGILTDDGRALAQRFFQAISQKNSDIINEEYKELQAKMQNIVETNNADNVDVSAILKRATFMQDMLIRTNNAAEGKDDEFAQEFLKYLSQLV